MLKFSVLLPTKNRLELLKFAINSVLKQTYQNWEIIVADNCSEDDIASYVKSLKDDRIIYTRSNTPLSVTENWNVANNLAKGDYIVMLGDDDALTYGYFEECIEVIKKFNNPEALNYAAYIYVQPNVIPTEPKGYVSSTKNGFSFMSKLIEPEILSQEVKENLVQNSLKFNFRFGFNMQFFLYSKDLVKKMKKYGEFYQGPYPDYYSANMMMLISESMVVVPKELVIIGVTPKSYGYYYHNKTEKQGMKFHNASNYRDNAPQSVKKALCSVSEMDTAALATFAIIPQKFPQRTDLHPDIDEYFRCITKRIYRAYNPFMASFLFLTEIFSKMDLGTKIRFLNFAKKRQYTIKKILKKVDIMPLTTSKIQYINVEKLLEAIENKTLEAEQPSVKLNVVYLARGNDYGLNAVKDFLDSYRKYPAGIAHKLVIIAKGWQNTQEYQELCKLAEENNAKILDLPDDGLDLGAYFRAAEILDSTYFFFLASSITILSENWLLKSYEAFEKDSSIKLVGPMGSWESPEKDVTDAFWQLFKEKINLLAKAKKILKFYRRNNRYIKLNPTKFPNYHIRTCSFMLKKALFLEYIAGQKFPKTKHDTCKIEHCRNSLTEFVLKQGGKVVVVNSDGEIFEPENWHLSQTFRTPHQLQSMFSDKHIKMYEEANEEEKRYFERVTWGKI
mgnify:CR=1 FL=1